MMHHFIKFLRYKNIYIYIFFSLNITYVLCTQISLALKKKKKNLYANLRKYEKQKFCSM